MQNKKSARVKVSKLHKQADETRCEVEEKYRMLMENATEGIVVTQDGFLQYVNPTLSIFSGYSEAELTSRPFVDFVHPDDQKMVMEHHTRRLKGENAPERYVFRVVTKDGDLKWVEVRGVLVTWEGGPATLSFLTDITDRKLAEDTLRESEEKYRQLFENESDAVMIFDAETKQFEDANRATLNLYGYSKEEFLTLTVEDISDEKEKTRIAVQKVKHKAPESNHVPLRYFMKKDGTIFPGEISAGTFISNGRQKIIGAVRDITERKRNEEKLKEAESLLCSTFNAFQDMVMVIDKDLRVVMSNWKDHEYISEKERLGNPFCYAALMRRETPCERCHAMEVFATGKIKAFEHTNPIDRQIREIQVVPIFDDQKNVVMVAQHLRNITDRKRAEQALQESEQRFKSLFENAPIGFYRTTPDGRILDANPALVKMLGYSSFEELAAVDLETHEYHPEYPRRIFREHIERDGEIKGMESLWKRPDGTFVYIRENARVIRDENGDIVCYEGTAEDFTDQKRANEQIHTLSQQLIQAHESEHQMISRELHDRVAQDLSTFKIGLDTLFDKQPTVSNEVRKKVLKLSEILQGAIGTVRDLSYELRPQGLDYMGLIPALSMYCEEFAEKSEVKVNFQSVGMCSFSLDYDVEMNLYRLIQEGLNNIRKHASASQATVKLMGAHPNIILRIEDDGKGFDAQERARTTDREKRMGLRSMQERVSLLQGQMIIQSQPMKGTRIFIKFPYQEKQLGSKENHIDR